MELTKAEEQVMQLLWNRQKAFVKELIADMPEPKPAYTTVSTIIRILEKKGAVGHESFGKSHRYYPLVSERDYRDQRMGRIIKQFFGNSYKALVAHMVKEKNVSVEELDQLLKELKKNGG